MIESSRTIKDSERLQLPQPMTISPREIEYVNQDGEFSNIKKNVRDIAPGVSMLQDIISPLEAKLLIELAESRFLPSTVGVDSASSHQSLDRTSHTCFLQRDENPLIMSIQNRLCSIAQVPVSHLEPLQLLRYQPGQVFMPHHDSFGNRNAYPASGDRKLTIVVYLNDLAADDQGGTTSFIIPRIRIKPALGFGVMWENLDGDGKPNPEMLHGGEAPEKSTKYILTAWIRERAFTF